MAAAGARELQSSAGQDRPVVESAPTPPVHPSLSAYELLAFDLDGTLVDSRRDLARAVNEGLEAVGRAPIAVERVTEFVGNGVHALVARSLGAGASREEFEHALAVFSAYYAEHCVDETRPYPGVEETLARLAGSLPLALLTNKPERPSRLILERLDLAKFFPCVLGGDSVAAKKPSPIGLEEIATRHEVAVSACLYVGDSAVDWETAEAAGADFAFASYGYQPETGNAAAPARVLTTFPDLLGPARGT